MDIIKVFLLSMAYSFGSMIIIFPLVYLAFKWKQKKHLKKRNIFISFLVSTLIYGFPVFLFGFQFYNNISPTASFLVPLFISMIICLFFYKFNDKN